LLLQAKGRTKGIARLGENSATAGQSHRLTSDGEAELPEPTTFEAKPSPPIPPIPLSLSTQIA
jgi:hypothetical protein